MKQNTTLTEFVEFPKIARLSRECVITEKIDGTNGCIAITEYKQMLVGSTRWITPEADNYGFAAWAQAHKEELIEGLGVGRHFGEWWGCGIQRGYGLKEKRFSLFNTVRWCLHDAEPQRINTGKHTLGIKMQSVLPACCGLVPVLYRGLFNTWYAEWSINELCLNGSKASPGFHNPEGIVVYHIAGNVSFKKTIEKDEEYKGKQ